MKIAISSTGEDLQSQIDTRFGRCKYFIIVDNENLEFQKISNESAIAAGGAGIKAAETIVNQGAEVVITGNIGPNAFRTLNAAGIKIYAGIDGIIKDAIEKLNKGELKEVKDPSVESHSGMNR